MHRNRYVLLWLLYFPAFVFAQYPNNVEGDWSGAWTFNNPLFDRGVVRAITVQAGATGTRDFLFNDGPMDYTPEFKLDFGLTGTNPQPLNTRRFNLLQNTGNNIQFSATTGNWYTIIVEEAFNANDLAILESTFQPVSIDSAFRCPVTPTPAVSVSVSIRTSAPLHTGEQAWLRYTTDGFATSNFVQLTGNPLSATLPALPHGTTVQYYFLTTLSSITLSHADADYQALEVRFQGINTFFYTVDSVKGSATAPCDSFPHTEICGDGADNDGDGLIDGFDQEDCGSCAGVLGENVFAGGSFGTVSANGQNLSQPDPQANPGVVLGDTLPPGVTTYSYGFSSNFSCVNGSLCFPDDGNYVIATSTRGMLNAPSSINNWIEIEDNGPEPDGYMMVVNAAPTPGIFYLQQLSGLCPSTLFEVSFDVANLILPGTVGSSFPNIDFVLGPAGADLTAMQGRTAYANTGDVPQDSAWHTYSFTFIPPDSVVTLALRSNNPGGIGNIGNDLAIDNISFRPCGPLLNLVASATVFCPGTAIFFDGTLGPGYSNPVFQWQYSPDSGMTWVDISGATGPDLMLSNTTSADSGWYRLLAAESGNLGNPTCRIASDPLRLQEQCPLQVIDRPLHDDEAPVAFSLHPNPSGGLLEVTLHLPERSAVDWGVYDLLGRRAALGSWHPTAAGAQHFELDLRGLAQGAYLLRIESEALPEGLISRVVIW